METKENWFKLLRIKRNKLEITKKLKKKIVS